MLTFSSLSAPAAAAMPTAGTSNPPYQLFINSEPDANGQNKHDYAYQCITMMPAYRQASLEELRLQDYQQGRKSGTGGPPAAASGFGAQQQPAFGQPQQQQGGLFGQQPQQQQTGLFGAQPQQQQTGGLFGQPAQQPAAGGLFGQQNTTTGGGLFGAPQQQQQQPTGGLFGQQQQQQPASTGFTFGGASAAPAAPAAGATGGFTFGQTPAAKPATGGLFGSTAGAFGAAPAASTSGFGGFGSTLGQQQPQQQQQPAQTGFGGTSGGFTFGGAPAASAAPKPGGLFGSAPQTSSAPSFGGFGAASSAPGAAAAKPAFSFGGTSGATAGGAAAPATGGLFGNSQPVATAQPGGLFGGLGGGFGQPQGQQQQGQQQQQQPASGFGGGLFGAKPATGGLFGAPAGQQQQQQPAAGGGLFGGGGGLFGNTAAKPAAPGGGLGGSTAFPSSGLFGGSSSGGALFGGGAQNQGASTGGLFGQSQNNQAAPGGGLFGASTLGGQQNQQQQGQQAQQPNFQASLNQDPYGTDALFANGAQGGAGGAASQPPLPFNVSASASKRAPPLVAPFRNSPRNAAKITRLRGSTPGGAMGFSTRDGTPGREGTPGANLFGSSLARHGSPATGGASLFRGLSDEQVYGNGGARGESLPPQAFVSRPSVKRLVLDDSPAAGSAGASNSFSRSIFGASSRAGSVAPRAGSVIARDSSPFSSNLRGGTAPAVQRVAFSPALETGSSARRGLPVRANEPTTPNEGDASFASSVFNRNDTPSRPVGSRGAREDPDSSLPSLSANKPAQQAPPANDNLPLDYYTSPPLRELDTWGAAELSAVPYFVVGRKGYGSVRFVQAVDLTSVGDLRDVPGGIVQIRSKECFVYPDEDDCYDPETGELLDGVRPGFDPSTVVKAPQGSGLNVPAVVSLEKCWPTDRATRQPLKDADHPRVKQHITKLQRKEETKFEEYEAQSGTWRFRVEHFSRYGLDDSDEEDGANAAAAKAAAAGPSSSTPARKSARPAASAAKETPNSRKGGAPPSRALGDADDEEPDDGMDADDTQSSSSSMRASELTSPPHFSGARVWEARAETPRLSSAAAQHQAEGSPAPSWSSAAAGRTADSRRVQVMQASFFGQTPKQASPAPAQPAAPASSTTRKHPRTSVPGAAAPLSGRSTFSSPAPAARVPAVIPATELPVATSSAPRKFIRTDPARSAVAGSEHLTVDAGLARGRSFRVGWGPDGTIAHIGKLVTGPAAASKSTPATSSEAEESPSSSTVRLEKVRFFKVGGSEVADMERLLRLQLDHSEIEAEDDADDAFDDDSQAAIFNRGCPAAYIRPETRFRDFAASFDSNDRSHEAVLWRMGVALFDEIDLRLPAEASRELQHKAMAIRRKAALSACLAHAVASTVEAESRGHVAASRDAALVFTFLTGNQLERACGAAIEAGDVRLATLVAQAGSGDDEARADVSDQLATWRREAVDAHISKDHRRVYELLAGNVTLSEGTAARSVRDPIDQVEDLQIAAGLDWKRAFGLHLWYDTAHDATLTSAVERYEAAVGGRGATAPPLPPYRESSALGSQRMRQLVQANTYERDGIFQLIKLFAFPAHDLESALTPSGFGPALADLRLPWHLYQLLSRALRHRDFGDRLDLGVESGVELQAAGFEGNSARADGLTSGYAQQLELQGQWLWAAFVLLHLELPQSREAALKALLARNVSKLGDDADPASEQFLTERLRIPRAWIFEARAHEARSRDDRFEEYELLIFAGQLTEAHAIAVRHLAPEAIIRGDLDVLLTLFAPFHEANLPGGLDDMAGWKQGGRVYVDYVACVKHLPYLLAHREGNGLDAADEDKLARLAPRVAELLELVPGLFQDAKTSLTQTVARSDSEYGDLRRGSALETDPASAVLAALHNLARALSVRSLAPEPSGAWDASAPPEVEALQNAANDYCALLM
jgi:nuclear pore complex protein Nup98-Nup96